jgi:hypothetical protein
MEPAAGRARSNAAPRVRSGAAAEFWPGPAHGPVPAPPPPAGLPPEAVPGMAAEFTPDSSGESVPGTASAPTPGDAPGQAPGGAPGIVPGIAPGATPGPGDWPQGTPGGHRAGQAGAPPGLWMQRPDDGSAPPPAPGALRARLASDPRMPIWIRRAVASAVVGVIVSVLADWRLGLTAAAVIAISDTIHRSRTTAAVPAALRAPSAHRRTRRRLARLDRAGYRALHARAVPETQCVVDHLVIGPGGIYSVDSERWDRRLPVRATKGGKLYHGPFCQADRLSHALLAADESRRVVSAALGRQITVQPALVIYGPTVPWTVASVRGVDVFCGRRLRKYLQQTAKASSAARLGSDEIERIYAAAAEALPPAR